jgi:hypothetical protein
MPLKRRPATAIGIDAGGKANIVVMNGEITSMGSDGIRCGDSSQAIGVRSVRNGGNGIVASDGLKVERTDLSSTCRGG